ncbi:formylglycine-generating enzyme family protein [Marinobacter goseongensis]|uniref:formylglycine-generating enzyme family protein n=1 Tax=Marinobacter goseongensis TaxID=453838 RepID=UPI003CFFCAEC
MDLPTEAQWEYAARSGGRPLRHATNNGELEPGRNISSANGSAWSLDGDSRELPEPPGRYQPSPIGLYDMSGNVAEWVNDYYHADYYQNSARTNPVGPAAGKAVTVGPGLKGPERVMRGGDYHGQIINSSTVSRRVVPESSVPLSGGFRCASI